MSLEMASTAAVTDVDQVGDCPAYTPEGTEALVCDLDCTAPVLSTVQDARAAALELRSSSLEMSGDLDLAASIRGPPPSRNEAPS